MYLADDMTTEELADTRDEMQRQATIARGMSTTDLLAYLGSHGPYVTVTAIEIQPYL